MLLRNDSVYHMTYISYHMLDIYLLYDFLYNTCIVAVCFRFIAFLASSANFGFSVQLHLQPGCWVAQLPVVFGIFPQFCNDKVTLSLS